jgi:hypothetical protein
MIFLIARRRQSTYSRPLRISEIAELPTITLDRLKVESHGLQLRRRIQNNGGARRREDGPTAMKFLKPERAEEGGMRMNGSR